MFRNKKWEDYLKKFVLLIHEELDFSISGLDDKTIRTRIEYAYKTAISYRIFSEPNINVFIYASFALGEHFYQDDQIFAALLNSYAYTEDQRIGKLGDYIDQNIKLP